MKGFSFRKKAIVIEAVQYPQSVDDTICVPVWFNEAHSNGTIFACNGKTYIKTLEGDMLVGDGDWIIRGVMGEIYPCKHDIFKMTYDPVE